MYNMKQERSLVITEHNIYTFKGKSRQKLKYCLILNRVKKKGTNRVTSGADVKSSLAVIRIRNTCARRT